jgi:uncharacterized protein YndB with AHSA1/START domain
MPSPGVVVHQHFDNPPEAVFDAWTDRDRLRLLMLPTDEIVAIAADARVGGLLRIAGRRKGAEIEHVGTYQEVARARRLVFTWAAARRSALEPRPIETRVALDFIPASGGTELTLTHTGLGDDDEVQRRSRDDWRAICERLAVALRSPSAS